MSSGHHDLQLLERRAVALAEPIDVGPQGPTLEILTVTLEGGRAYALETRHIAQILRNTRLCRLPAEGGELIGLTLVKGAAVPVADLGALLELSPPDPSRPFVLLLDGGHLPLGLLVDDVVSFGQLTEAEVRPSAGEAADTRPVERGVTAGGLVLLDVDLLLAHARLKRSGRTDRPHPLPQQTGEPCER